MNFYLQLLKKKHHAMQLLNVSLKLSNIYGLVAGYFNFPLMVLNPLIHIVLLHLELTIIVFQFSRCLQVEVFGSYRTGLYLPSSDIDVCIVPLCLWFSLVISLDRLFLNSLSMIVLLSPQSSSYCELEFLPIR